MPFLLLNTKSSSLNIRFDFESLSVFSSKAEEEAEEKEIVVEETVEAIVEDAAAAVEAVTEEA